MITRAIFLISILLLSNTIFAALPQTLTSDECKQIIHTGKLVERDTGIIWELDLENELPYEDLNGKIVTILENNTALKIQHVYVQGIFQGYIIAIADENGKLKTVATMPLKRSESKDEINSSNIEVEAQLEKIDRERDQLSRDRQLKKTEFKELEKTKEENIRLRKKLERLELKYIKFLRISEQGLKEMMESIEHKDAFIEEQHSALKRQASELQRLLEIVNRQEQIINRQAQLVNQEAE